MLNMKRQLLVTTLSLAALALAGCSSSGTGSSGGTSTTVPSHSAVLGATTAAWDAGHPQGSNATSFGPKVKVHGAEVDQYHSVSTANGRITGWQMYFPQSTRLGAAESMVRAQLPADSRQTASWRGSFAGGGYCEFVNYASASLATNLGTTSTAEGGSNIGVKLFDSAANGAKKASIAHVNSAVVGTTPFTVGQPCG